MEEWSGVGGSTSIIYIILLVHEELQSISQSEDVSKGK